MGVCNFVDTLNKLRKSSSDSIDNVMKFEPFKEYMHITRKAEDDLRDLLREIKKSNTKKLVLLCGSAGDGKSHLLSYLKNSDDEKLLEDFVIYNDATESSEPQKTAIETLDVLLDGFSDQHLHENGKNVILAINLGVLSNFIESPIHGERFNEMRKYVEDNDILTTKISSKERNVESVFQHISFADYHMYTLTENGIKTDYIEKLLDKIFEPDDKNVFFQAYTRQTSQCPLSGKCPVKCNYEFLQNKDNRKYIADLLVQTVIKDKLVLTTREILNYVYDILVANDFSYSKLFESITNPAEYLKEYIRNITPSLMFDYIDVSNLMNITKEYDPLLFRNEQADELAISYNVSNKVQSVIAEYLGDTPYANIFGENDNISIIEQSMGNVKASVYNTIVRVNMMKKYDTINDDYRTYIKDLYYYNIGKVQKLSSLYGKVQSAVCGWCGTAENNAICINDFHNNYSLYENINFVPYLDNLPKFDGNGEIIRFVPKIKVSFSTLDKSEIISLDIDYSLYKLICNLTRGYVQTANDRNNHADFMSFVRRMIETGSADEKVLIKGIDNKEYMMEKTGFGYKFKVV